METALYFPYMRVPRDPWFTQVLLYWDATATIVPDSLMHSCQLGDYVSDLVGTGLLSLVSANDLPGVDRRQFEDAFLAGIAEAHITRANSQNPDARQWMHLHAGKMGERILDNLEQRGVARMVEGSGWEAWWHVDKNIANLYMSYLAGAICGSHPDFLPVTDSDEYIATLGLGNGSTEARLRNLQYTVIMRSLPTPSRIVPAIEIMRFKDAHREELHRLRNYLSGALVDVAAIDDEYLRQAKNNAIMQEIEDDVNRLREAMSSRRWPRVVLAGLGGVAGSALALAATIATGGGALALGLGVASGVAGVAGGGYQVGKILNTSRFDRRAPLVYAALTPSLYDLSLSRRTR